MSGICATCYPQSRVLCFAIIGPTFYIFTYDASPPQMHAEQVGYMLHQRRWFYGAPLTDISAVGLTLTSLATLLL